MMKASRLLVGLLAVATATLTACSSSESAKGATNRTFTMAISSEPGSFDPNSQTGASDAALFAYDHLIYIDQNNKVHPWLAEKWSATTTQATFTIRKGITCSDGTPFTASDVAANIEYEANPKNAAIWLDVAVPQGAKATADDASRTVTVTVPQPNPFLLYDMFLPYMVCKHGLEDPKSLRDATDGTGMFKLTGSKPGTYTFAKRNDYTWGPLGAKSSDPGLPSKVVLRVVTSEATAANLLLSGQLNAAPVFGPDRTRLEQHKLYANSALDIAGELFFNERKGHVTSDPNVRRALTMAANLKTAGDILTDNHAVPAPGMFMFPPVACPGDVASGNIPAYDPTGAATLLDESGWAKGPNGIRSKDGVTLAVRYAYQASDAATSVAELFQQEWQKLGVKITLSSQSSSQFHDTRYKTGDWDVTTMSINGTSVPNLLVPFFDGPTPPEGVNFAGITNSQYAKDAAQASTLPASSGCKLWNDAQVALFKNVDVVPYVGASLPVFGNGATFGGYGFVLPPTIKMK